MHRKISILVLFLLIIPTFAQTDDETETNLTMPVNAGYGLMFMLPEGWTETVDADFDVRLQNPEDETEYIRFRFVGEFELAYVDFADSAMPLADALIEMYLADMQPPVYETNDGNTIPVIERLAGENSLTIAGYDATIYGHNSLSGTLLDTIAIYIPEREVVAVLETPDNADFLLQVARTLQLTTHPSYNLNISQDLILSAGRDYLYVDSNASTMTLIWYTPDILERRNIPATLADVIRYEFETYFATSLQNFDPEKLSTTDIDGTEVLTYRHTIEDESGVYEEALYAFQEHDTIFVISLIPATEQFLDARDTIRLLSIALSVEPVSSTE